MPTAAVVNVSLRARHEQFTADMDKMSQAGKRWAGDMQASGGRVSKVLASLGIQTSVAARSFGQVATGALMASGAMDGAGQAGQALTHSLGAFLVGGPIAGGVTLVAEAYKFLAGEEAKAAEQSRKNAAERIQAIEKERAKTDDLLAKIHERDLASQSEATGTPLAELKLKEEILALESETWVNTKADVNEKLNRLAILRDELALMQERRQSERLSELGAVMMLGITTELKIAEVERTKNAKHLADAAAEQAAIEKRNREQWQAGEEIVRNMEQARLRSVNQFIAAQERLLGLKADEVPYQDIIQKREEAILGGLTDQVAALDSILARKREQAALAERIAAAEKALASAASDVERAKGRAEKAKDAKEPGGAVGGGSVGGPESFGGGGSWSAGGFGGGSTMGPLAAAREAKRQARQQRQWQRHADNLRAESRERMGTTIDDFGGGGFGFISGDQPAAKPKGPMTFPSAVVSDEHAAANDELTNAINKHRDATLELNKQISDAASKTGEVAAKTTEAAGKAEENATAAGDVAVGMADVAGALGSSAAALVSVAPSIATMLKDVQAMKDAIATIQAAASGW